MAVLLETSMGDLVIDLDLEGSSVICRNFLKLCKARQIATKKRSDPQEVSSERERDE